MDKPAELRPLPRFAFPGYENQEGLEQIYPKDPYGRCCFPFFPVCSPTLGYEGLGLVVRVAVPDTSTKTILTEIR